MPSSSLDDSRSLAAFIHRGAWGDLYVSLAALADVCARHDHVVVIGSDKWKSLIDPQSWPKIREIWVSENGKAAERYGLEDGKWVAKGSAKLTELLSRVVTTYNLRTESLRYGWAPLLAKVPNRHGSAPFPWSLLLYTHRAPWLGKDPRLHERDRMLQVVEAPDRIGERAKAWAKSKGLPALKKPDAANSERLAHAKPGTYVLVNPTSSRREKAWPSKNFRDLVASLHADLHAKGLTWRIIGAPSETEWLRECLPTGCDAATYVVQPPTIADLCDILSGAKLLVTNTSSMQFLAPGYDLPTITLMGRGDPEIWGPLGLKDTVVHGTVDPALNGKIFEQERKAYESIPLDQVRAIIEIMLT